MSKQGEQVVLKHFTKGDLETLSVDELLSQIEELKKQHPDLKIGGTAVVRRADGTIRKD